MTEGHRSGPVRSDAARRAILEATAQQFHEKGYDHLTIEGIAQRAGTGKQTVYRWWGSKGELLAEALLEGLILPDTLRPPDTGDLEADLSAWLQTLSDMLQQPRGEALMRSLIAAAAEHAEVGRRLRATLGADFVFTRRLQAEVDAHPGEAPASGAELTEALLGLIIVRALSREPLDPSTAARLVQVLTAPSA
ncbi:TetR/AcrR family transcriptional regulator [Microbacterium horticulturae]|uniref:TetR/AcrR family transcriptional regulator n=1 Tax=Microbacterium horticulturae TaxID=3028316 RepID=A0ABY8BYC2_9MICO|nr:TetR/AcrR family transcriptional regulator [Microbacterium sp. KACC 23027]WEG08877.1 TetR/AcrR family transcriptional regulator [Microbacterium sp. KACC 23027]